MAGRQNGAGHGMPASTGQRETETLASRLQVYDLVWNNTQAQGAAVLAEGVAHERRQIAAVQVPRDKSAARGVVDLPLQIRVRQLPADALKPVHEVHRLVRVRV